MAGAECPYEIRRAVCNPAAVEEGLQSLHVHVCVCAYMHVRVHACVHVWTLHSLPCHPVLTFDEDETRSLFTRDFSGLHWYLYLIVGKSLQ